MSAQRLALLSGRKFPGIKKHIGTGKCRIFRIEKSINSRKCGNSF